MVADPAAFRYGPLPAPVVILVLGVQIEGAVGDFADIRDDVARLAGLAPYVPVTIQQVVVGGVREVPEANEAVRKEAEEPVEVPAVLGGHKPADGVPVHLVTVGLQGRRSRGRCGCLRRGRNRGRCRWTVRGNPLGISSRFRT